MFNIIKSFIIAVIITLSCVWGVLALYFGDSANSMVQTAIAGMFGLSGLVALIGLRIENWRKHLLSGYAILFGVVLIWWLCITPSNERVWQPDVSKLAYADFNDDLMTVHNIRNFDYRSEFDYQPAYYTKTFDINKLQGIDLISVYWMGPAIAHTMLSFYFGGNDYLTISIEARKESTEGYSTIKGFFRQFELIYIVADERDLIRLRTNYRKDPPEDVYIYRLQGPLENGKRLLKEYFKKINELNENPTFYNTLLDNCTTAVWLRSRVNPQHLSFSWKILLSGYFPEYLYESGRLDNHIPFDELKQQAYVNNRAKLADQAVDFSTLIRRFEVVQK